MIYPPVNIETTNYINDEEEDAWTTTTTTKTEEARSTTAPPVHHNACSNDRLAQNVTTENEPTLSKTTTRAYFASRFTHYAIGACSPGPGKTCRSVCCAQTSAQIGEVSLRACTKHGSWPMWS